MELGTALLFVASYIWWPVALANGVEIAQFTLWLICGVMMVILFAYDVKWFLLPDRVVFPAITVAAVFALLELTQLPSNGLVGGVISLAGALTVLSGLYLILWVASKGRWIGFGDVKLGIILGLLIGRWELAFLALFIANLIGCLIVLPGLITKTLSRTTQIPFGPMLIGGFLLAFLWGESIINWYLSTTVMLMV
jgi:leader peptidase (prepilin peptidase)/N-methyltransferase